ncbi:hypothetical protein [Candidatus Nitrotoga fabula]|uniref:Uncharacterized protein n=1 Tax=Candidatus Nitrotoga fabula TaxID=2182327 RepID=A0A916FAN1_9PROT|nr:hypothetical protein [Candidatus Nitrotoga fabula]CAE6704294.1 hypothetical protein NTGZN8_160083 [Candidatus Nitrotoga fabula]
MNFFIRHESYGVGIANGLLRPGIADPDSGRLVHGLPQDCARFQVSISVSGKIRLEDGFRYPRG